MGFFGVCVCVCVSTPVSKEYDHTKGLSFVKRRGPGRIHRRLVNEAGDVSEDMEMGRHFHALTEGMVLGGLVRRFLSFC